MTLDVSDLSVERSGRVILHPTSLTIEPGERIGMVGASGSGKSTLGHILLDTLSAQGHRVAHVPQSPDAALDPLRSMGFQLREAARALGVRLDEEKRARLFSALCIETGDLRKRPWAWSRGMQQRFVIAMALIGTPALLVLDEPTSALDPVVAARTMDALEQSLASGPRTSLMLITHDIGLAARRVDRLLIMDDGRIVEDAPTQQLLRAPKSSAGKDLVAYRSWASLPC